MNLVKPHTVNQHVPLNTQILNQGQWPPCHILPLHEKCPQHLLMRVKRRWSFKLQTINPLGDRKIHYSIQERRPQHFKVSFVRKEANHTLNQCASIWIVKGLHQALYGPRNTKHITRSIQKWKYEVGEAFYQLIVGWSRTHQCPFTWISVEPCLIYGVEVTIPPPHPCSPISLHPDAHPLLHNRLVPQIKPHFQLPHVYYSLTQSSAEPQSRGWQQEQQSWHWQPLPEGVKDAVSALGQEQTSVLLHLIQHL